MTTVATAVLMTMLLGMAGSIAPAPPVGGGNVALSQDDVSHALEKLAAASAEIKSIRARFKQTRKSPLLRKPLKSEGSIQLTEGLIVWQTEKPKRSTVSVDKEEVRFHYPDDHLLEIYLLEIQPAAAIASPLLRVEVLRKHFEIALDDGGDEQSDQDETECARLRLTPKENDLRRYVRSVRIEVDIDGGIVRRCVIEGGDGEETEYEFSDVETNPEEPIVDPTRTVPEGTFISRPGDQGDTSNVDVGRVVIPAGE